MAPKKILICLDGTGNDPADAEQKPEKTGQLEDDSISNVLKLHLLAGGQLNSNTQPKLGQMSFYYSGVGTRGTIFQRALGSAFANFEPHWIRTEAYNDLCRTYETGDKIYIFGFSRGAAIARMLASHIAKEGLVLQQGRQQVNIAMVGVWDTVASFGKPNLHDSEQPISDVVFENGTIAQNIEKAYHLVAVDETRLAFRPTLMNASERVTEIWFSGVHSDVGGGYRRDGLSDVALSFMIDRARAHGIQFTEASAIDFARISSDTKATIELDDVEIRPDPLGHLHEHRRDEKIASITLKSRRICVNVNDQPSEHLPLLHHSVVERIKGDTGYRPSNIKGVKHRVLQPDGTVTEHGGLEGHM
ncbi:MAG: DUF2235 domain-containing protein [Nitrospira sp. LK70]|nr:DUF2235 domain-containing protein [Nitrospira sp. LK70]